MIDYRQETRIFCVTETNEVVKLYQVYKNADSLLDMQGSTDAEKLISQSCVASRKTSHSLVTCI